ncbi:Flp pilus assembly protein CpaB [Nocardioides euryhalodurans]|uniref:Flp pilus assembly protein CpaB n=2 Tax=Nocardioides euryhalodurans TaxID=2518370 RepID=A0A4P7GPZ9_9ACTN|nr:Flp pilus assembly protein CpaB [Nocardioides euryhalodurans]
MLSIALTPVVCAGPKKVPMDRRRILLVVAVIVALLGTSLVFLYVRGADQRAESRFETVDVLRAVQPIEVGESIDDAAAAGKIAMQPVVRDYLQNGYQTSLDGLSGQFAATRIYAGEQIVEGKFDATVETASVLPIPDSQVAVSVDLTDTARVAGFVNPGSQVAIYLNGSDPAGGTFTRLLLERVTVIGVGSTTPTQTTTTSPEGAQTTEALPRTLMTLALDQADAEKVLYSQGNGELAFLLLTEKSRVNAGPGITAANLFQ